MDIIEENKLLRQNYALRQENDWLKENLEKWRSVANSRHQIIEELAYAASDMMSSWEQYKLYDHDMPEHVRGQLYAFESMFRRMKLVSDRDPDILQIISEPVARYESFRDYVQSVILSMTDEQRIKKEKKKARAK